MKKSYDSKFKSRVALEAGKRNSWKELSRFSSPRQSENKANIAMRI